MVLLNIHYRRIFEMITVEIKYIKLVLKNQVTITDTKNFIMTSMYTCTWVADGIHKISI